MRNYLAGCKIRTVGWGEFLRASLNVNAAQRQIIRKPSVLYCRISISDAQSEMQKSRRKGSETENKKQWPEHKQRRHSTLCTKNDSKEWVHQKLGFPSVDFELIFYSIFFKPKIEAQYVCCNTRTTSNVCGRAGGRSSVSDEWNEIIQHWNALNFGGLFLDFLVSCVATLRWRHLH